MTEFKKLVALTDTLQGDVDVLEHATLSGELKENCPAEVLLPLKEAASRVKLAITDGIPRMRKITLKARETDPNKQIYNENMCAKIETVFHTYCALLARLYPTAGTPARDEPSTDQGDGDLGPENSIEMAIFDPQPSTSDVLAFENAPCLEAVEDVYNAYLLRMAEEEAWQARVAMKLDDVALFEAQGRAVLVAEEKKARAPLSEEKRQDKLRIQLVLRAREEAKWQAEETRRKREHTALGDAASHISPVSCSGFVQTSLPPACHALLGRHLSRLARALITTPEDMNIRKLRNNNAQFLRDFGHIGLVSLKSEEEEPCICSALAHVAEVVLYRIGYRVRYTGTGSPSPIFLANEGEIENVVLPCGELLSCHIYHPLGFESYSERYLELSEPDAMHNPDDWMEWYTSLQSVEASLATLK